MRINRFIALYSGISRRKADQLITDGKVAVNRKLANPGMDVSEKDAIIVDGVKLIPVERAKQTVLLHKPVGYVCSRNGQGSSTVYDLLPNTMRQLKIAGRLDRDSSGLIILSDDGQLLQQLTHPSNDKEKVYEVELNKHLEDGDIARFARGVNIGDTRKSKLSVMPHSKKDNYEVRIYEGRNRQIRRSFEALGYQVKRLHRIQIGSYKLGKLEPGEIKSVW